jgi:hypothetical protein
MKNSEKIVKPRLNQCATLGSLVGYGEKKKSEWTTKKKLKIIKEARFAGFVGRTAFISSEQVRKSGLMFACTTDLNGVREIRPKLKEIKATGARVVNVQMLDHNTGSKRAIEVARRLMDQAEQLDMDVSIEVHRDTCTETPEKTYALAEGFERAEKRKLKLTWDFSHPAIIKHLSPPYWDRLAERPDLIQFSNQFHFRPFNGHHAQIPALDIKGKYTPEFKDWLEFAERVFSCWLSAAEPGREIFVCPEQIAGGYHISVFGDRWKDVIAIKKAIDKAWKRQLRSWKGSF